MNKKGLKFVPPLEARGLDRPNPDGGRHQTSHEQKIERTLQYVGDLWDCIHKG